MKTGFVHTGNWCFTYVSSERIRTAAVELVDAIDTYTSIQAGIRGTLIYICSTGKYEVKYTYLRFNMLLFTKD